jgi:hypothetical protein
VNTDKPKKRYKRAKIYIGIFLLFVAIALFLLHRNFNFLVTQALKENYERSILSEVYELKFENLNVNLAAGTIKVNNVSFIPRVNSQTRYPYINSTIQLSTDEITLEKVEIFTLLRNKELILERISISRPDVNLTLNGERNIYLPYGDTTATDTLMKRNTLGISLFNLHEFTLIDASVKSSDSFGKSSLELEKFNISLYDLHLEQQPGVYAFLFNNVAVSFKSLKGSLHEGPVKDLSLGSFNMNIDSLRVISSIDTIVYKFSDFNQQLTDLDVQSRDSLFHISLQSFDLKYSAKTIKLKELNISPNVSQSTIQKNYKYQHTTFSGQMGSLEIKGIDFDAMIYQRKLMIDEIAVDSAYTAIYKDKTKPIDPNKKPPYIGQIVAAIETPVHIKKVKITRANLNSTERKDDGHIAKVGIYNGTMTVDNFTNLLPNSDLLLNASAYIEGKAPAHLHIAYAYNRPEIKFYGSVDEFNLPDLNRLIQSYTPAQVISGVCDKIAFSGTASETAATGTFEFLYHDLTLDLQLHDKAKWKSSVLTFASNSILNSSNPQSSRNPSRKVQFHIERNMNKGFINVLLKSIVDGLKETMVMGKENKASYKEAKKQSKRDSKEAKKEENTDE